MGDHELLSFPTRTTTLSMEDIDWIKEKLDRMETKADRVHEEIFHRLQCLEVQTAITKTRVGLFGAGAGGMSAVTFEFVARFFGA